MSYCCQKFFAILISFICVVKDITVYVNKCVPNCGHVHLVSFNHFSCRCMDACVNAFKVITILIEIITC